MANSSEVFSEDVFIASFFSVGGFSAEFARQMPKAIIRPNNAPVRIAKSISLRIGRQVLALVIFRDSPSLANCLKTRALHNISKPYLLVKLAYIC